MMVAVVEKGTGTTAQIPGRPGRPARRAPRSRAAGGRRTPGSCRSHRPTTPKVAVAVIVEDGGVDARRICGNGLAAPIAKAVMEAVLGK